MIETDKKPTEKNPNIVDGVFKGTLKHGLKIGETVHKEFEMRGDVTAQDMFDAEQDTSVNNALTFNGAMMAKQLIRIGTFDGAITLGMIGKLRDVDYSILRSAQIALQIEGNAD